MLLCVLLSDSHLCAQVFVRGQLVRKIRDGAREVGEFVVGAMAFDHCGNLFITALGGAHCVHVLDRNDGKIITSFGQPGSRYDQMLQPAGVAVAADGRIFVADAERTQVHVFAFPLPEHAPWFVPCLLPCACRRRV